MNSYGNAFRVIRLIKKIPFGQAATDLNMDERTLRKIEDGETEVITQRFDQMLEYYHIEPAVVFELAKDQRAFSNVIHNLSGDSTVFNQNPHAISMGERDKRITDLEERVRQLIDNDKFNKSLIEHQQGMIEQLLKGK